MYSIEINIREEGDEALVWCTGDDGKMAVLKGMFQVTKEGDVTTLKATGEACESLQSMFERVHAEAAKAVLDAVSESVDRARKMYSVITVSALTDLANSADDRIDEGGKRWFAVPGCREDEQDELRKSAESVGREVKIEGDKVWISYDAESKTAGEIETTPAEVHAMLERFQGQ